MILLSDQQQRVAHFLNVSVLISCVSNSEASTTCMQPSTSIIQLKVNFSPFGFHIGSIWRQDSAKCKKVENHSWHSWHCIVQAALWSLRNRFVQLITLFNIQLWRVETRFCSRVGKDGVYSFHQFSAESAKGLINRTAVNSDKSQMTNAFFKNICSNTLCVDIVKVLDDKCYLDIAFTEHTPKHCTHRKLFARKTRRIADPNASTVRGQMLGISDLTTNFDNTIQQKIKVFRGWGESRWRTFWVGLFPSGFRQWN